MLFDNRVMRRYSKRRKWHDDAGHCRVKSSEISVSHPPGTVTAIK
jgi:hypothetical protein